MSQLFEQEYIIHGDVVGDQIGDVVRGFVCQRRNKKTTRNKGSIFSTALILKELRYWTPPPRPAFIFYSF